MLFVDHFYSNHYMVSLSRSQSDTTLEVLQKKAKSLVSFNVVYLVNFTHMHKKNAKKLHTNVWKSSKIVQLFLSDFCVQFEMPDMLLALLMLNIFGMLPHNDYF